MKTMTEWLDEYSESHQNKTNKAIHWVCVPTILFSIIGILAHFSALLTALTFDFNFALLCTPRLSPCCRNDCSYCSHGMAHFYFACRNRILYCAFHFSLDWAILRTQSRRKKAFILQRPPIPPHWPCMVHEYLSKQTTTKI